MSTTNLKFTNRAKAWVKDEEPGPDEIQDAYKKMRAKADSDPTLEPEDVEHCLEFLVHAYGSTGKEIDDLLAPEIVINTLPYQYDPSPLVAENIEKAPSMSKEEKQEAFKALKRIIAEGMTLKSV